MGICLVATNAGEDVASSVGSTQRSHLSILLRTSCSQPVKTVFIGYPHRLERSSKPPPQPLCPGFATLRVVRCQRRT